MKIYYETQEFEAHKEEMKNFEGFTQFKGSSLEDQILSSYYGFYCEAKVKQYFYGLDELPELGIGIKGSTDIILNQHSFNIKCRSNDSKLKEVFLYPRDLDEQKEEGYLFVQHYPAEQCIEILGSIYNSYVNNFEPNKYGRIVIPVDSLNPVEFTEMQSKQITTQKEQKEFEEIEEVEITKENLFEKSTFLKLVSKFNFYCYALEERAKQINSEFYKPKTDAEIKNMIYELSTDELKLAYKRFYNPERYFLSEEFYKVAKENKADFENWFKNYLA